MRGSIQKTICELSKGQLVYSTIKTELSFQEEDIA